MPGPSQIVRFRQQRRSAQRRNPQGRLGLSMALVLSLAVVLASLAALAGYLRLTAALPSLETIPARLEPPNGTWLQPTRLYDRSGEHLLYTLENSAAEGRQYLTVSQTASASSFAQSLVDATVAAVDPTFWDHPGYSLQEIRAGSHPTIAQRLVSDLLLSDEPVSLMRNLRERLLAGQLISRYGHAKVLEWYLNSTRYGPLIYGADAAARVYFGKPADDLSVAEAALIVAAAETPQLSPASAPQVLMERQAQIVAQMLLQGWITPEQAHQAAQAQLQFLTPVEEASLFLAFTNLAIEQAGELLTTEVVERGGLRILTSLDYDLQLQAQCAAEAHIRRLQGDDAEVQAADGSPCEAARLLPTLPVESSAAYAQLAASLVVLDADTGQVLALVGETQPGHAAGPLLAPFIYLSAFTYGYSPATLIWDVPAAEQAASAYFPGVSLDYHGPVRLRTALANNYLGAAAQLYQRVGAEQAWQTARQLGMVSLGEPPNGLTGVDSFMEQEVTLLESAYSYSVFTNLGLQMGQVTPEKASNGWADALQPAALLRVEDSSGQVLVDWSTPQMRSIVSPQLAYLVTDVLSDEMAHWPSLGHPNPLEIGRPAGAHLAASLDGSQAWTVGFTPQVVVGAWLGNPGAQSGLVPPLNAAALWNAVIKTAIQTLPVADWQAPSGLTSLEVCDPSGLLPTRACPAVVEEVFIAGNEPTQADTLYQVMAVNRETGLLATVFTPPELVEDQVFLRVPAWAEPWAEQAGLPVPPDGYDPIYAPEPASSGVSLAAPAMFAHVHGQVELRGSAGGEDFAYYRIQVGQGLYPQQWLQVGGDVASPVADGLLGVWDTGDFQGLYVIRLLVVHTDQTVEDVILQVTVDNTPPQVTILDPAEQGQYPYPAGDNLLLQADAQDDLALERVEFYLDDNLYLTLWQPPFVGLWPAEPGEHTLLVRVYDLAGNASDQSIQFTIQR